MASETNRTERNHEKSPEEEAKGYDTLALAILNSAAARNNGHAYAEFFIKRMERGEQEPSSVLLSATRLLYHMGNIFRDNAPIPAATCIQIDRKRLARLRQKRVALGHKPDDHELEQQQGFSMKFHM